MIKPIQLLKYPVNKKILLKEAQEFKDMAESYFDARFPDGKKLDNWLIYRHESEYSKKIMDDFEVQGKVRFYWLEPNSSIPLHVDYNTKCSINFILSENQGPVTIQGVDYFYSQALLNTSVPHCVNNGKYERVLFKISIFDTSFEDLAKKIKYKDES